VPQPPSAGGEPAPAVKPEPINTGNTGLPAVPPEPKKADTPPPPEPKKSEVPPAPAPKKADSQPPPFEVPPLPPLGKKDPVLPDKTLPKTKDPHRTTLSKENQEKVNAAIEKGIKFIKSTQRADGGWDNPFGQESMGYCALPALTLLECGVPANDLSVQKAASYIRTKAPTWLGPYTNYDVSLALLFLDKLNDKKDHELIRFLALRLIASQRADGGWNYGCNLLNNKEAHELLAYLQAIKPVPGVLTPDGAIVPLAGEGKNPEPPQGPVEPVFKPFNTNLLSPSLRKLAVVQTMPGYKAKGRKVALNKANETTDNSNSQFAIMALWVARKYDIPVDKTMALVDQRFLSSQLPSGGWDYHYLDQTSTPPMTCVGLIGLAAGHGAHKESLGQAWKMAGGKSTSEDFGIKAGLGFLAKQIGDAPADWSQNTPQINLYLLWSIERVAVLYNLKTIGGKDWYSWAAHMLVVNQQGNGSWVDGKYAGQNPTVNSCLALLTLKRANFVPDLTEVLEDFVPIRDPGQK
jgi:hypothetical protein